MSLKFTYIANPPDVIPNPVGFTVRPVQFLSGQLFGNLNCFKHGAIGVPTPSRIVYLANMRVLIKMPEHIDKVKAVNIVSDLFGLVAKNSIRFSGNCTPDKIRQKTMQLSPRMSGARQTPASEACAFQAKISSVFLHKYVGGRL